MKYFQKPDGEPIKQTNLILSILVVIFIISAGLSSVALEIDINPTESNQKTRSRASSYKAYVIGKAHGGSLVGGLEHGNFDNDSYSELVTVGATSEGIVSLIDYNNKNNSFDPIILWWDPEGSLVDVAVGELDSSHNGPEIVVGGYSGRLNLLYYFNKTYTKNITIWNSSMNESSSTLNHIYGLDIGDLDNRYAGNEIALADAATMNVYILFRNGSVWEENIIPINDVPRNLVVGEFDAEHPGLELLVMCINGTVYEIAYSSEQSTWVTVEIFKDSKTPFNAIFGDFNETHTGNEIIITGLSKNTTLLWGAGDTWYKQIIWTSEGQLEGICLGDFDHNHDGEELCLTGYLNTAILLYQNETGWYNELIYTDPDTFQTELNGALVVDFYPHNPGSELIIIGFLGKIRMLTFLPPDFELTAPSTSKTVTASEFTTFQVILDVLSGYSSKVRLDITGLPPGTTFEFSDPVLDSTVQDKNNSILTIYTSATTLPETYNLTIIGKSLDAGKERYLNVTLEVDPLPKEPDFRIKISPPSGELNLSLKQYHAKFEIEIESIEQFDDQVNLYLDDSSMEQKIKKWVYYNFTITSIKPGEIAELDIYISEEVTESFNLTIPLRGYNLALDREHDENVELDIIYYEPPKKPKNDDQADDNFNQLLGLALMMIVIIVIVIFMMKRMRDISRQQEELLRQRAKERSNLPPRRTGSSYRRKKGGGY